MAWITSNSVSVSSGSKTVTVTGNVDLSAVDEGWAVQIGSNPIVEASSGTAPDGSGNSTLTLMSEWPNATATSAAMSIIPNSGYQITLADRIKAILARTVEVMQLQHDYASQLGQVTATDPDTNQQHVYNTLRQNQQEMDDLLATLGTAAGYDVTSTSTDTSNGSNGLKRLMRPGDFGGYGGNTAPSLSSLSLNDLNNIPISSFLAAGVGSSNLPVETSVTVNTNLRNADHGMQDLFTSDGQTRRYFRIKDAGAWLPYVEMLHTGNTGPIVTEDYEEGTWSCTLTPSSGFTPTSNTVTAHYRKVGEVVTVFGLATMDVPADLGAYPNNNTSAGLVVSGLPFNIASGIQNRSAPSLGVSANIATPNGFLSGHGTDGNNSFSIYAQQQDGSSRRSPTISPSTVANAHFCFTYLTN